MIGDHDRNLSPLPLQDDNHGFSVSGKSNHLDLKWRISVVYVAIDMIGSALIPHHMFKEPKLWFIFTGTSQR